jgi:hypothetical protein
MLMEFSPRIHSSCMQCAPIKPSVSANARLKRMPISALAHEASGRAAGDELAVIKW